MLLSSPNNNQFKQQILKELLRILVGNTSIQTTVCHIASEGFLREKMEGVEISEPDDDQLRANMLSFFFFLCTHASL